MRKQLDAQPLSQKNRHGDNWYRCHAPEREQNWEKAAEESRKNGCRGVAVGGGGGLKLLSVGWST